MQSERDRENVSRAPVSFSGFLSAPRARARLRLVYQSYTGVCVCVLSAQRRRRERDKRSARGRKISQSCDRRAHTRVRSRRPASVLSSVMYLRGILRNSSAVPQIYTHRVECVHIYRCECASESYEERARLTMYHLSFSLVHPARGVCLVAVLCTSY